MFTKLYKKNYGDKIVWNGKEFYSFPTPEQLSKASVSDLRKLGLGFRDVRVYETTKIINNTRVLIWLYLQLFI